MITEINRDNIQSIRNPAFQAYAGIYVGIYENFMEQVNKSGISIDAQDYPAEASLKLETLRRKGALARNDSKSIYINHISPSCLACQQGVDSATFFIS
jgi:uncharacterized protein